MTMRIAIIKPSALGDICHALPVLSAFRDRWPDSHITWVVNRSFEGLLTGHPDLNATLAFDRAAFGKGLISALRSAFSFGHLLRRQRFDLVVDLQGLARTGLMTKCTGAKRTVGFANAREGAKFAYLERVDVPDADRIHAVDRYWRVVEHLGANVRPMRCVVPVSQERIEHCQGLLKDCPRPWTAVAVGAKWLTKRWPPAKFGELLARAQTHFGGTVIFVGVKDDSPLSLEAASKLQGPWRDLCGQTDLPTLTAMLKTCDVMLANDTGPLHLAAALGTPCVAPYTCTKVVLHGPYGQLSNGVETGVPCTGSYLKKCPHQFRCFDELGIERLWPTLERVMKSLPGR